MYVHTVYCKYVPILGSSQENVLEYKGNSQGNVTAYKGNNLTNAPEYKCNVREICALVQKTQSG